MLRSVVQSAEADPLSLLLAAKAAVAASGDAVLDGVALARYTPSSWRCRLDMNVEAYDTCEAPAAAWSMHCKAQAI